MGNSMSGNIQDGRTDPGTPDQTISISGADYSSILMSAGFVYKFFGEKEDDFSLPVFFGPAAYRMKFSQRVQETNATDGTYTDFDMSGDQLIPAAVIGIESSFNAGRYFRLNPFVIGGGTWDNTGLAPTIGTVRTDTQPGLDSILSKFRRGTTMNIDGSRFVSLGLNVFFKPWGLGLNVTSPIMSKWILALQDDTSLSKINLVDFSFSWSFGHYTK